MKGALNMPRYSTNYLIPSNVKIIRNRAEYRQVFGIEAPPPDLTKPAKYWYDIDVYNTAHSASHATQPYYTFTTIFDGFGGLLVDAKRTLDWDPRVVFARTREIDILAADVVSLNLNIEEAHPDSQNLKGTIPVPRRPLFEDEGLIRLSPFHEWEVVNLDLWYEASGIKDKQQSENADQAVQQLLSLFKGFDEKLNTLLERSQPPK